MKNLINIICKYECRYKLFFDYGILGYCHRKEYEKILVHNNVIPIYIDFESRLWSLKRKYGKIVCLN